MSLVHTPSSKPYSLELTVSQLVKKFPSIKKPKFFLFSNVRPPVPVLNKTEASPSYSFEIHFNIIHSPDPCAFYTFQMPNLMSNSHSSYRCKGSVTFEVCEMFRNAASSLGVQLLAPRATTKLEDTPCRMSAVVYYQLLFLSGHSLHLNLRTHHNLMTWTQLIWLMIHSHYHHHHHYHLLFSIAVT